MVSTISERRERAKKVLTVLVGGKDFRRVLLSSKKPDSLPKSVNYTQKEWISIHDAIHHFVDGADVSILTIFDLEEMEHKYSPYLMLRKLEA